MTQSYRACKMAASCERILLYERRPILCTGREGGRIFMKRKIMRSISLILAVTVVGMSAGSMVVYAAEPTQGAEEIVYTDNVVTDVDMDYSYEDTVDGVKVVTQDEQAAAKLQEGDILILSQEGETERAVEVTSVIDTDDGYVIEGAEPEQFSDVVEYVDASGTTGADVSDIVTDEGVSVRTISARGIGTSGSFDMTPLRFQIDRSLDGYGSIKGSIVMTPTLEYRVLFDFGGLEELELKQRGRLEITDLRISCQTGGVIPIATVPYTFAGGMFTAYVKLQLVYTAAGQAYLDYVVDGYLGVAYDGEQTSFLCDYNPEKLSYGIEAYGDVGANLSMGLMAYGTYTLMDVELNAGIKAEGRIYDSDEQNNWGVVYFYLDGSFGKNSVLSQYGVYGTKVFFDRDNSPLKYEIAF